MPNLTRSHVVTENDEFLMVIVPGQPKPLTAAKSGHPQFDTILSLIDEFDEYGDADILDEIVSEFDVAAAVAKKFNRLSDRVTVNGGHIFLDGDEVENGLTKQIVRFLDEGADFTPLVRFMEKIETNPQEHSRTQAWDWLNNHDFTLTPAGDVIGYKGVSKRADGSLVSGFGGHAIVNGEDVNGKIPNEVGNVVEMPRSEVAHDPAAACRQGLHVGTFDYAKGYASGAMLKVIVNPRDIVSVPTDANGAKIRVCRYTVDSVITAPVNTALDAAFDEGRYEDAGDDLDFDL